MDERVQDMPNVYSHSKLVAKYYLLSAGDQPVDWRIRPMVVYQLRGTKNVEVRRDRSPSLSAVCTVQLQSVQHLPAFT